MSTVARLAVGGSKSGRDLERRLTARGENHGLYIPNEPARDLLLRNQEEDVGRINPPRVKLTGGVMLHHVSLPPHIWCSTHVSPRAQASEGERQPETNYIVIESDIETESETQRDGLFGDYGFYPPTFKFDPNATQ
ncbi:hypothetical protein OUZ56_011905 [Daphnia magna]|uniref:Uncharacterized protein n=1 Tax=Daphnia magna TaxID=35525 RepID=A0ABQ9Z1H1_9CRUS|nr:hypothetical protein OUZ56_011905 [Daphnia magna]